MTFASNVEIQTFKNLQGNSRNFKNREMNQLARPVYLMRLTDAPRSRLFMFFSPKSGRCRLKYKYALD